MPLKQDFKSKAKRLGTAITAVGLSGVLVSSCFGKDDNEEIREDLAHNFAAETHQEHVYRTEDNQNYYYDIDGMKNDLLRELHQSDLLGVQTNLTKEEKSLIYLGAILENGEIPDKVCWELYEGVYDSDKDTIIKSLIGDKYDPSDNKSVEEAIIDLSNKLLDHELSEQQKKELNDEATRREADLDFGDNENNIDINTINVDDVKKAISSGFERQEMLVEFEDGSVEVLRTNTK